jgi:hypothetical protein
VTPPLLTGNARAPLKQRRDDLYETPPVATEALLQVEDLPHFIWEPACGPGSIVRVLRAAGKKVLATDLVDYASADQDFAGRDFLMESRAPANTAAIVTNPPYKLAEKFVAHALMLAPKVIMLLRLAFLESQRRSAILDGGHLARVHLFSRRLPMMHRAGWPGPLSTSAMCFAWFCWSWDHKGPTTIDRISWEG